MTYLEILNSARTIDPQELIMATDVDGLRQLVCALKQKELDWDIRYHKLENAIDANLDTDKLVQIYESIDEYHEPMVKEKALILCRNSRDWNLQHRQGLEDALIKIVNPSVDKFSIQEIAFKALKKHSIKYLMQQDMDIIKELEPFKSNNLNK